MVVLVLTAIVIGLAFSVLSLTQKQMSGIQSNFLKNDEWQRFEQSLWIDFNRYAIVQYDDKNDRLLLKNELDSVRYDFRAAYVVRNIDTLNVAIKERLFYLDGQLTDSGIIDALEIKETDKEVGLHLFIHRKKDATHYMNNGF